MASPPLAAGHNRPGKAFMALIAVAFPILPGKTKEWQDFIAQNPGFLAPVAEAPAPRAPAAMAARSVCCLCPTAGTSGRR